MRNSVLKHSLWLVYGSAGLSLLSAAIVFYILPQFPAVRGSQPLDVLTPLSYQVLIFIPFGILLAEIVLELLSARSAFLHYVAVLAVLCGVSLLRFAFFIPVSGHCLLLGYYLPRQSLTHRGRHPLRLGLGLVAAVHVLYYKLFIWVDLITPVTGFLLGLLIWIAGESFRRRFLISACHDICQGVDRT
ncbi:hypothetical protein JW905_03130 [bacterium]|nr:hypothetical protein [candidate division CSSED10-310 bacterium]